MKFSIILVTSIVVLTSFITRAQARDQVSMVGSSTVFPYAQAVAEEYSNLGGLAPVIESTGTGGGFKLFCAGIGLDHPDVTGASRAIKESERKDCAENGVEFEEILIGYDGIVFAYSAKNPSYEFTTSHLYSALAKELPYVNGLQENVFALWGEIDPNMPFDKTKITVYGPPPTSGTRDAFVELVFHKTCKSLGSLEGNHWNIAKTNMTSKTFKKHVKEHCTAMRTDGPFIEAGENDNLILQRLVVDPNTFGIFGYSFLHENRDKVQAAKINGVLPSMETIANGSYILSRPLYVYVKKDHVKAVPGLEDFVAMFTSEDAVGEDGYLVDRGLVRPQK